MSPPASVTVISSTCAEADAWATALMVAGADKGARMAKRAGLDALVLLRPPDDAVESHPFGCLFSGEARGDGAAPTT